jgi:hypothetical protein
MVQQFILQHYEDLDDAAANFLATSAAGLSK